MKYKLRVLIVLLLAGILCNTNLSADVYNYDYGLFFNSHQVSGHKRTSLLLDDGKAYAIKSEFAVDFQMFLRENEPQFGSILHFITNENQVVHFTFAVDEMNHIYPALIYNDGISIFHTPLRKDEWVSVSLSLDIPRNQIKVSYAGKDSTFVIPLQGTTKLKVQFGRTENYTKDVVPMNVKDIRIFQDGEETRYWKLWKHNGDVCLDEREKAVARAEYPSWLVDNHVEWKQIFSSTVTGRLDVAFNARDARFYLIRPDEVEAYDCNTLFVKKYTVKGGYPVMEHFGHCIYDTLSNKLISYSLSTGKVSRFSFEEEKWSETENLKGDPWYFNHARAFNAVDSSYYFFGGYGHYRYHNGLFRLKYDGDSLQKVAYDNPVDPRFASAMTVVGDKLYILGGRGNKLGRQAVESYFYYDMWCIDLQTKKAELLWNKKNVAGSSGIILASSMCFLPKDSSLYALNMDDAGGKLLKFSMRDSVWTSASRAIGNIGEYQNFDYTLYHAPSHKKIYLLVDKILADNTHNVSVYSINLPLQEESEIVQLKTDPESFEWYEYTILAMCLLAAAGYGIWRIRRKRKFGYMFEGKESEQEPELSKSEIQTESDKKLLFAKGAVEGKKYFDRSHSSISLMGTFNVRDKEGNDITVSFTPKLKELLILLILFTEKNGQGILIKRISDFLWFDKEEESARNNRNVTLRKLRVLLETVGDVEVVNNNGFIYVKWGADVFCDYHTIQTYMKEFKQNNVSGDEEQLNRIFEILLYGPLLPNTIITWLDEFKDAYSSLSIDLLSELLNMESTKQHSDMMLRIVDIMFLHDPLNEEALAAKCTVLSAQGKRGIAKSVYERFCKEYKNTLGEDYKVPFSDLVRMES